MKKKIYIIFAALMMLPTLVSAQQNLRSAYFLDGYTYKYKMNPANAPERGFFAIPVLGSVGLGIETNLGLSTFLYPTESGRLTTFLSPRVTNESFLNNIAESNKMNLNIDTEILGIGFRTGKSFHTVDLSMRIDAGMNIPGGFFRFMKVGGANGETSWDLTDIGLRSSTRLEAAYGYSRSIGENLRIGARAKLLLGVYRADIAMDKMSLEMSSNRWAVSAHGNMHLSAPVTLVTKGQSGSTSSAAADADIIDWGATDMSNILAGLMSPSMGFAVDLGATYDFLDYFTVSLSVSDLGFMSWKNSSTAETPDTDWEFKGFSSFDTDEISEQLSTMTEEMMSAFNFSLIESEVKMTTALAATVNAGFEARMPFYERLSFGLLYTQRIEGAYSWSEGRLSANLAPVKFFSLTTNYAISNYGHSWGGAINLHLPGFGIFAGLDSFTPLLNVTPQYIPIDALNTNLVLGININFGKYNGRLNKTTVRTKKPATASDFE